MKERDLNRRIEAFLKLPNALAAILVASFVGQACSSSGLKTNAGGPGGNVDSGGTVGSGGTIVPGLAVFAGVPSGIGTADGTGAAARFNEPAGVAVHGAGNIFVVDNWNHTIRKITPSGVVTTLAGTAGLSGSADGTGAAARFYRPEGVAVDGAGNVFVADNWNHTIRKITPSGVVTTLAGTANISGSADGGAAAARFYYPSGVAVDGAGNLFVADSANFTIRKITPNGVVTTLAGSAGLLGSADGTGAAARFDSPCGLAVDGAGNVFVADNYTIRKITPSGVVTTLAGLADSQGSADGTGAAARFNGPSGVAVDGAGNLFVRDSDYNTYTYTIRKITYAGVVTTLAGMGRSAGSADGTGAAARFSYTDPGLSSSFGPTGVAVDGAGSVFVADTDNDTIRKITPTGVVTTLAGTARLYGSADGAGAAASFGRPQGVAVDGVGNVFVADTDNNTIRKIEPSGVVTTLAGPGPLSGDVGADGTGAAARFDRPFGVAADETGNVFVADGSIRKITLAGVVTTLAGSAELFGSADGTGAAARFYSPSGVAVDGAGNVFVADTGNNAIRKITPAGVVTTLAGSADGTGAAALFNGPQGVAVDGTGNVFVADTGNNAIRKISTSGVVTTVVGVAAAVSAGNFPGPLPASIVSPVGVAIDASTGKLYITLQDAVMVAVLPN